MLAASRRWTSGSSTSSSSARVSLRCSASSVTGPGIHPLGPGRVDRAVEVGAAAVLGQAPEEAVVLGAADPGAQVLAGERLRRPADRRCRRRHRRRGRRRAAAARRRRRRGQRGPGAGARGARQESAWQKLNAARPPGAGRCAARRSAAASAAGRARPCRAAGCSRRGRATMRSRSARTPPSSSRSARTTWPTTSPPAVLERTRPSETRPSRVASSAGMATPLAPVSIRNSTGRPLSFPAQW